MRPPIQVPAVQEEKHMHPRRSHPFTFLALVSVLLLSSLLVGCQKAVPTVAAGETAATAGPTATPAPPTATKTPMPTLPSTWTPRPQAVVVVKTPTTTPTLTSTPNFQQTMAASNLVGTQYPCTKYDNAWMMRLEPSWRQGWCTLDGDPISYYEYNLEFPSGWKINTFGDRHPNIIFITGFKDVEVRLYQVYAYETMNYTGTLDDAPAKASFCEKDGSCAPVVNPLEKTTRMEKKRLGPKNVIILDGIDGKRYVRRYFFMENFVTYKPASTRLFIMKIYTAQPINTLIVSEVQGEEPYLDLLKQIENVIISVKPDPDRKMTPWPSQPVPTDTPSAP